MCLAFAASLAILAAGCHRGEAPATSSAALPAVSPASPPAAAPVAPNPPATAAPIFLDVPTRFRGKLVATRVRGFPTKLLALTFDDGPSRNITPRILATLKKRNAHATFFELGSCIQGNEDLTKRIFAEGHAIGSHSYNHLSSASAEKAASELEKTRTLIKACTGHSPQLFRPPYGITKGELNKAALHQSYVSVLWTISSADTDAHATIAKIANNVIHTPNPGDIVLMHDSSNHDFTARALPQILDELGASGYKFVTLPELFQAWDQWQSGPGAAAGKTTAKTAGG
jgi:peptidoglycan-N-acetylglucosamine deacetylase